MGQKIQHAERHNRSFLEQSSFSASQRRDLESPRPISVVTPRRRTSAVFPNQLRVVVHQLKPKSLFADKNAEKSLKDVPRNIIQTLLRCDHCDAKFKTKFAIKVHLLRQHGRIFGHGRGKNYCFCHTARVVSLGFDTIFWVPDRSEEAPRVPPAPLQNIEHPFVERSPSRSPQPDIPNGRGPVVHQRIIRKSHET